jgi:hypothetical protein
VGDAGRTGDRRSARVQPAADTGSALMPMRSTVSALLIISGRCATLTHLMLNWRSRSFISFP